MKCNIENRNVALLSNFYCASFCFLMFSAVSAISYISIPNEPLSYTISVSIYVSAILIQKFYFRNLLRGFPLYSAFFIAPSASFALDDLFRNEISNIMVALSFILMIAAFVAIWVRIINHREYLP